MFVELGIGLLQLLKLATMLVHVLFFLHIRLLLLCPRLHSCFRCCFVLDRFLAFLRLRVVLLLFTERTEKGHDVQLSQTLLALRRGSSLMAHSLFQTQMVIRRLDFALKTSQKSKNMWTSPFYRG